MNSSHASFTIKKFSSSSLLLKIDSSTQTFKKMHEQASSNAFGSSWPMQVDDCDPVRALVGVRVHPPIPLLGFSGVKHCLSFPFLPGSSSHARPVLMPHGNRLLSYTQEPWRTVNPPQPQSRASPEGPLTQSQGFLGAKPFRNESRSPAPLPARPPPFPAETHASRPLPEPCVPLWPPLRCAAGARKPIPLRAGGPGLPKPRRLELRMLPEPKTAALPAHPFRLPGPGSHSENDGLPDRGLGEPPPLLLRGSSSSPLFHHRSPPHLPVLGRAWARKLPRRLPRKLPWKTPCPCLGNL